jgi:sedoheptulose-bisphosphatase
MSSQQSKMNETKAALLGTAPSCTSFYTDVTEQDSYPTIDMILQNHCNNIEHQQVIYDLLYGCEQITNLLRTTLVYVSGTTNEFGDVQLSVDMKADDILWNIAKSSNVIYEASSEEDPILRNVRTSDIVDTTVDTNSGENYGFTVCWDPLDGSSIVDNNWAVGTIIGVWPCKSTQTIHTNNDKDTTSPSFLDGTTTGRHLVTSMVAMYGPRTTVLIALDDGTYEFTYGCNNTTPSSTGTTQTDVVHDNSSDEQQQQEQRLEHTKHNWICTRQKIQIRSDHCRIFSPANLRATQDLVNYHELIQYYLQERYTLRYTGGLVPDIYQQFTKQQGIYINPTSDNSPAKLRLTYEAIPIAYIVEKANGTSSDTTTGQSILDIPILSMDQRTPLCVGSTTEVDRCHTMLKINQP